jgi:2-methylcitrate dehydratase PrpD
MRNKPVTDGLTILSNVIVDTPSTYAALEPLNLAGLALVDFIGVALSGSLEPVSEKIIAFCRDTGSKGPASVIGAGFQTGLADAVLANGTIGHALDFDDSNFVLGGHPSVTLLPAVLALGEAGQRSGRDVLHAYVTGFEVMMRIAHAVNFEHYEKGWHPTATLGIFGAAAASAKLLGLDQSQSADALGLAASMASGIKSNFGAMAKPLQVGHAAQKGLLCALWAKAGITASRAALTGRQGFFMVYNGEGAYRLEALAREGDEPEILRSGLKFKRYACCGSTHVGIDAAREMRRLHDVDPAQIKAVHIAINPRRIPHVNKPNASDALEAKFSVQFTVAASLIDNGVSLSHFSEQAVSRPDIRSLMAKVSLVPVGEGEMALSQPCVLTVEMNDGRELTVKLDGPVGREADKYPSYMRDKFTDCALQVMDAGSAGALLEQCLNFVSLDDIGPVLRAAAAGDRQKERALRAMQ